MDSPKITIDPFTAAVSPLLMYFEDTELSVGTCFFWENNGIRYLVTNKHNATGKDTLTGKHISETLAEPDELRFTCFQNQDLNCAREVRIPLLDDNEPLWLEHPHHTNKVDVVCIKLPPEIAPHVIPINTLPQSPLAARIADEVFILGYPLGVGPNKFPIWKRASVASEPDIDVDNLPKFFVDTMSTHGMSGSPVIRRAISGIMEDGSHVVQAGGPITKFVGVYSGRLIVNGSTDAQLGIVWKKRVINEIIDASKLPPLQYEIPQPSH